MERRHYRFEVLQVILSLLIVAGTVFLFLHSRDLTFMFPLVFGLGTILMILDGLEGIIYNRNRMVKKSRMFFFGSMALVMGAMTFISARAVF